MKHDIFLRPEEDPQDTKCASLFVSKMMGVPVRVNREIFRHIPVIVLFIYVYKSAELKACFEKVPQASK